MRLTVRKRAALAIAMVATLLGAAAAPLSAQAVGTIRGKVVESGTQRPLSGVQVSVPGTGRGALSNAAGDYLIAGVPTGSHSVRAQMIGYATAEQAVEVASGEAARVDFQLSQSAIALDAVVVTGTPGATQKRAIGNAVESIAAAQVVDKAPIASVAQVLQGRSAGMTLIQSSGAVGTATNIRIRGAGSLNAGTQPIFVIDGVRMSGGGQGGFSVSGQRTSALDAINPEDIESIEIIKGPAAATLYGADAAAGVVQIITKKGKVGQQKVEWGFKTEYGQNEWATDISDRYTYCDAARNNGAGTKGKAGYVPAPNSGEPGSFPACAGMDPNAPAEQRIIAGNNLRDDPDALRTGVTRGYTLSARGGGDNYSFYLSGDKDDNEGIFRNNYFQRLAGRGNLFFQATDQLDFTLGVSYAQTETRLPNNDNSSWGMLRNTYRAQPGRLYNYAVGYANMNPAIINGYNNITRAERNVLSLQTKYQPTTWFRNSLTVGMDWNQRNATLFFARDTTGKEPYGATNATGYISQYTPATHTWTVDYSGTISRDINSELTSNTSFGTQFTHYQFRSLQGTGEGLTADKLNLVSAGAVTRAGESFNEDKSLGVFVQQQLGWRDRAFVTGTLRLDDNSTFGADYSGAVYPNIQGSWVISEEPFFNVAGVDMLKLRAAWGMAGKAPAAYQADRTYAASSAVLADNTIAPAFTADTYGNPLLKSEEVVEFETGFEAALLDGRAGIDLTFYNKTTNDAMMSVPVAPSSGFGIDGGDAVRSILTNVGSINNRGLEVGLNATPVATQALTWDSRVNFSVNRNRLTSWGGTREDSEYMAVGYRAAQRHALNMPLGGFYGTTVSYNADGTPKRNAAGALVVNEDTVFAGSSIPTRELGFSNTFTVLGNLSLYSFLEYKGGHYQFNMTEMTAHQDRLTRIQVYQANDAEKLEAEILRSGATLPFMSKADNVRLRELSLTYNVPTHLTRQFGTERLSVSLAGRNLGLWTKYDGPDPEVNIEGDATFTRADYMSVPATRQWVATVNVSF
jgi:TonB-linked SusC/RagA family outer membrane protein